MTQERLSNIPLEEVQRLLNAGMKPEVLVILNARHQLGKATPGTWLTWARLAATSNFPYLALLAARKEHELFGTAGSSEFEAELVSRLTNERTKAKDRFQPISILAMEARSQVPQSDRDAWKQMIESVALQRNQNTQVVLLSNDPSLAEDLKHPLVSVANLPPSGKGFARLIDSLPQLLLKCSGEIVSFITTPSTIFSELGLMYVGATFASVPNATVVQTERIMYGIDGCAAITRHNYPRWDRKELLDENRLFPPVGVFCEKGVFWRKDVVLREALPVSQEITEGFALDMAIKIASKYPLHTLRTAASLDRSPIEAKSYRPSIRLLADARTSIVRAKQAIYLPVNSASLPEIVETGPKIEPSSVIPRVAPEVLLHGESCRKRISIVTAVLNDREHIARCIDSILSQNYPNLEYIIVDGGSTDGTVDVIKKYEKYLASWSSEKDPGHYFAVNKGLSRATGDILTWLNSDDYLTPYSLRVVSSIFAQRPDIHWLTGHHAYTSASGTIDSPSAPRAYDGAEFLNGEFDSPFIQQEGTFWRRELWEKCGACLDLRLDLAADLELWARFFQETNLVSLNVPLAVFMNRPGQRSDTHRTKYLMEAVGVLKDLQTRGAKAAPLSVTATPILSLPTVQM